MLIKAADDHSKDIVVLKALLTEPKLTRFERERIEEELYSRQKGAWGEEDAAYFLNFNFRGSEAHLILHDLQIVLSDGRSAQIDHLLVNSFQDFYLLESKNWDRLTVEKNGSCTTGSQRTIGTESSLEQSRRHAKVLARAFEIDPELKALVPRFQIIPRVLMAPRCHLVAPHHEEWYVKADMFYSQRAKEVESISIVKSVLDLPRYTSRKTLIKIGEALLELHNPKSTDWREKFGLTPADVQEQISANRVVAAIDGLASHVPEWGENWFVLKRKPSDKENKTIRDAGYRPFKENGLWVWRLKL